MKMAKYNRYEVQANYGNVNKQFYDWRLAREEWSKCRRMDYPTTVLGFDKENKPQVIYSTCRCR